MKPTSTAIVLIPNPMRPSRQVLSAFACRPLPTLVHFRCSIAMFSLFCSALESATDAAIKWTDFREAMPEIYLELGDGAAQL